MKERIEQIIENVNRRNLINAVCGNYTSQTDNEILELIHYIDQQDQIIREAREYVKEHTYDDSVDGDGTSLMFEKANGYDLLEILDRNVK